MGKFERGPKVCPYGGQSHKNDLSVKNTTKSDKSLVDVSKVSGCQEAKTSLAKTQTFPKVVNEDQKRYDIDFGDQNSESFADAPKLSKNKKRKQKRRLQNETLAKVEKTVTEESDISSEINMKSEVNIPSKNSPEPPEKMSYISGGQKAEITFAKKKLANVARKAKKKSAVDSSDQEYLQSADESLSNAVFDLLSNYQHPENTVKAEGLKCGMKNVKKSIEKKEAKLVVIPIDTQPIFVVRFLVELCKKEGIPYVLLDGSEELTATIERPTIRSCLAVTKFPTPGLDPVLLKFLPSLEN